MTESPKTADKERYYRLVMWEQNIRYVGYMIVLARRAGRAADHGHLRESMIPVDEKRRSFFNSFGVGEAIPKSALKEARKLYPYTFPTEEEGRSIHSACSMLAVVALCTVITQGYQKDGLVEKNSSAFAKGALREGTLFVEILEDAFRDQVTRDRFVALMRQAEEARSRKIAHSDGEVAFPAWGDPDYPAWIHKFDSGAQGVDFDGLWELLPFFHASVCRHLDKLKHAVPD